MFRFRLVNDEYMSCHWKSAKLLHFSLSKFALNVRRIIIKTEQRSFVTLFPLHSKSNWYNLLQECNGSLTRVQRWGGGSPSRPRGEPGPGRSQPADEWCSTIAGAVELRNNYKKHNKNNVICNFKQNMRFSIEN